MFVKELIILLVEDNPDHVFLTLEGFKKAGLAIIIRIAEDGQQALDYLFRKGKYNDDKEYPMPDLILLDINLPKKSGIEVLQIIKENKNLKGIPTVMLTTSQDEVEIKRSYQYGANSFITKPVTFKDFMEKIKELELYWCVTNTPPPPIYAK